MRRAIGRWRLMSQQQLILELKKSEDLIDCLRRDKILMADRVSTLNAIADRQVAECAEIKAEINRLRKVLVDCNRYVTRFLSFSEEEKKTLYTKSCRRRHTSFAGRA